MYCTCELCVRELLFGYCGSGGLSSRARSTSSAAHSHSGQFSYTIAGISVESRCSCPIAADGVEELAVEAEAAAADGGLGYLVAGTGRSGPSSCGLGILRLAGRADNPLGLMPDSSSRECCCCERSFDRAAVECASYVAPTELCDKLCSSSGGGCGSANCWNSARTPSEGCDRQPAPAAAPVRKRSNAKEAECDIIPHAPSLPVDCVLLTAAWPPAAPTPPNPSVACAAVLASTNVETWLESLTVHKRNAYTV